MKTVTDHPFISLIVEILNLTHPRFALAYGREYTPDEAREPAAARKARERSFLMEFYHEFRRLWDRAVPVQRGLGHVIIQADPEAGSRTPDLLFWQLGEQGQTDRRLAAVSIAFTSNPDAVAADRTLLERYRLSPGYPLAVSIVVGKQEGLSDMGFATAEGLSILVFDTEKWQVKVASSTQ